ncbi:MAG: radical SAM protein [Lentisphaerae bacterium]|nr:radical SAM protein [Lentisphaerota bacterium]
MSGNINKYIFGPVPSRRFGLSLGVDLLPPKTCTMNCLFCQLGQTPTQTLERKDYVPMDAVLAELNAWFEQGGKADYVTLAGSGEPTLHLRFGDVLKAVRARGGTRSALLTNSSLLYLPEVRGAACLADVGKVSLSAWDDASFQAVNRPPPGLTFRRLIEGLTAYRTMFSGKLWLEIFLVPGLNTEPGQVKHIADWAKRIQPDRIHFNTAVRPAADKRVAALPPEQMKHLAALFDPPAEIIADFGGSAAEKKELTEEAVLAILRRHPCTERDLVLVSGAEPAPLRALLAKLEAAGSIRRETRQGAAYYSSNR